MKLAVARENEVYFLTVFSRIEAALSSFQRSVFHGMLLEYNQPHLLESTRENWGSALQSVRILETGTHPPNTTVPQTLAHRFLQVSLLGSSRLATIRQCQRWWRYEGRR